MEDFTAIILERIKEIKRNVPDCTEELFEMQNRICDLCGHPIQDLVLADLDHSIPVSKYAKCLDIAIEDAVRECNSPGNFRVAHASCNRKKSDLTREEWFARGLNNQDVPHYFTKEELDEAKFRRTANIRVQAKNGTGFFNSELQKELSKRAVQSITPEQRRLNGIKGGKASSAKFTPEEKRAKGIFCGTNAVEKKIGVHAPGMSAKGGRAAQEKQVGIFAPGFDRTKGIREFREASTFGQRSEIATKASHNIPPEQRKENGRIGQIKSNHIRFHVKRGIVSPNCILCKDIDVNSDKHY